MALTTEWLAFEEQGKLYSAYSARPERADGQLPTVLVLQEIWGVDAHIRDVTERYAKAGYWAVAPDLFAEDGHRPASMSDERVAEARAFLHRSPQAFRDPEAREKALAELPADSRDRIRETADGILSSFARVQTFKEIAQAAYRYVKKHPGGTGRAASVGYCMGGALSAALAGLEPDLAGAVVYYGRLSPDTVPATKCPVLGFFGGRDEGITSLVPAYEKAMKEQGKEFVCHIYDQAKHAFFNDAGAGYDAASARDAWVRTLAFLNERL